MPFGHFLKLFIYISAKNIKRRSTNKDGSFKLWSGLWCVPGTARGSTGLSVGWLVLGSWFQDGAPLPSGKGRDDLLSSCRISENWCCRSGKKTFVV